MKEKVKNYVLNLSNLLGIDPFTIDIKKGDTFIVREGKIMGFEWLYLKPDEGYGSKIHSISVYTNNTLITSFGLYQFPSCCAFCVSTRSIVNEKFRRKGVNNLTNVFRLDIARFFDYSAMICTDIESNTPQRKTLKRNGWKDIFGIENKRTGNFVYISVKNL